MIEETAKGRFFVGGGVKQLVIENEADLRMISTLDPKLWVCISAPVDCQEIPQRTLMYLDSDGDGRFRYSEVIVGLEWMLGLLRDAGTLFKKEAKVSLRNINVDEPEGLDIYETCQRVLEVASLSGEAELSLETLEEVKEIVPGDKLEALEVVEKFIRFHRDLYHLVNNFVSLPYFYNNSGLASFQAGVLFLDGYSYHLCIRVKDVERHSKLARKSGIFLVYCELTCAEADEPNYIVAAVTDYQANRLTEGMWGVFGDRQGRDWDARVVDIVRNPINLMEAILAPFKGIVEFVTRMVDRLTQSQKKALESTFDPSAEGTASMGPSATAGLGGLLAGSGVALAALSSSFAFIAAEFGETDKWKLLLGATILLGIIFLPSVVSGWLKLRARDLGMVLQASGWAINGRMGLSQSIAQMLTRKARAPSRAKGLFRRLFLED